MELIISYHIYEKMTESDKLNGVYFLLRKKLTFLVNDNILVEYPKQSTVLILSFHFLYFNFQYWHIYLWWLKLYAGQERYNLYLIRSEICCHGKQARVVPIPGPQQAGIDLNIFSM